jgi:transcriptional regulator with XRE-family HTH domain
MRYDFAGLPRRIKESRECAKMSREQLGIFVGGKSRQAVARWEQPYGRERNSVPDLETISEIADILRVDFLWLLTGQRYAPDAEGIQGVLIPVFALESFHKKQAPLFHKRTLAAASDETDGFRVPNLANAPEYLPGDVCVTEPAKEPHPGKMMVARLTAKGVNVFGRCVVIGLGPGGEPIYEIVPLKEGYPRFSSQTEKIELLAVVIELHKDLRNRD